MDGQTDDVDQAADKTSIPRLTSQETQLARLDSGAVRKPFITQSTEYHASSLISQTRSNQPVDLAASFWSDTEARDACLMRYFVEELAPWVSHRVPPSFEDSD